MNKTQDAAYALLLDLQNEDGGWGSVLGRPSNTEATALSCMALQGASEEAALDRGLAWLSASHRSDGAWPQSEDVDRPSWMTALAVLAMREADPSAALRGAEWLLDQEGEGYSWLTKLFLQLFPERDVIELDPDLKGWPWLAGTFSWVEPTVYSLLALKSMRSQLPVEATDLRIRNGELMIFDRMCLGGGWNYGNSVVLDEELWPYPDTTALALIALQDSGATEPIQLSLDALATMLEENDSGLATALAILCFDLHGRDATTWRERLAENVDETRLLGEARALALASLALDDSRQPMKVVVDA